MLFPEDLNYTVPHQACAGLLADARAVVDMGRAEAANYRAEYGRPIPCKVNLTTLYDFLYAITVVKRKYLARPHRIGGRAEQFLFSSSTVTNILSYTAKKIFCFHI